MILKYIHVIILATVFLARPMVASADTIYTWTDENGVLHMTNVPPVQSSDNLNVMEMESAPNPPGETSIQYAKPEEPKISAYETAVEISDDHVIVPAMLSYKGKMVNARLLLDTGSTNITLHKEIAEKLLVERSWKGSIRVAGGKVIDAEAVRLDGVTVGPHTAKNLVAGIIEHRGEDVPFDGLLGMNFLKNYQYTIDFEKKTIRWNKK